MSKASLIFFTIFGLVLVTVGFLAGIYFANGQDFNAVSPAIFTRNEKKEKPLLDYTIPQLREHAYSTRTIEIKKELSKNEDFTSYLFTYNPLGKKMSGQLNVPTTVTADTPVIVMIRGFVPLEIFSTGVGTKNAAVVFSRNGFITIAPDFFGYGESDPEPKDSWQTRFEKPIAIIELIKTIRENGTPTAEEKTELHTTQKIGIWGHSNGGQIAMTTLVTMQESIPTSLWAPVLAPFPYSVLYFTDEDPDEGKGMRIWLSQLEDDYELREFSFTQYLDGLVAPFQVQHGTADDAAPYIWSDEFVAKVVNENKRRADLKKVIEAGTTTESAKLLTEQEAFTATQDAEITATFNTEPIKYNYYKYPGADHNMQPSTNWDQAVQKDLEFFRSEL